MKNLSGIRVFLLLAVQTAFVEFPTIELFVHVSLNITELHQTVESNVWSIPIVLVIKLVNGTSVLTHAKEHAVIMQFVEL